MPPKDAAKNTVTPVKHSVGLRGKQDPCTTDVRTAMPSSPPTALQEIHGRINTLDKQIEQAHEQVEFHQGQGEAAFRAADRMSKLRSEYAEILAGLA